MQHLVQLGLPDKGRTIKGLVVCRTCALVDIYFISKIWFTDNSKGEQYMKISTKNIDSKAGGKAGF